MKEYIIVMADVIASSSRDQQQLMADFKELVGGVNKAQETVLVSPLTITLGDEFQGVLDRVEDAVKVVLDLEEAIIRKGMDFKLRYVVVKGLIETPINKEIAYGMLGDGLTRARKYLEQIKKEDARFFFSLKGPGNRALNNVFIALQDIIDGWNLERDYQLINSFLTYNNYIRVAMELKKDRSLMWKRGKSLRIAPYLALKETANYIAHA